MSTETYNALRTNHTKGSKILVQLVIRDIIQPESIFKTGIKIEAPMLSILSRVRYNGLFLNRILRNKQMRSNQSSNKIKIHLKDPLLKRKVKNSS